MDNETATRLSCDAITFAADSIRSSFESLASELGRPCAIFKPKVFPDGEKWCALYGDNLQEGCAGFGETPVSAMSDFDKNWYRQKLTEKP